jgi:hypothetical protein
LKALEVGARAGRPGCAGEPFETPRLLELRAHASRLSTPSSVTLKPEDWLWPISAANRRHDCWFERIAMLGKLESSTEAGWWLCVPLALLPLVRGDDRLPVTIVTAPVEPGEPPHLAKPFGYPEPIDDRWDGVERFRTFAVQRSGSLSWEDFGERSDFENGVWNHFED